MCQVQSLALLVPFLKAWPIKEPKENPGLHRSPSRSWRRVLYIHALLDLISMSLYLEIEFTFPDGITGSQRCYMTSLTLHSLCVESPGLKQNRANEVLEILIMEADVYKLLKVLFLPQDCLNFPYYSNESSIEM